MTEEEYFRKNYPDSCYGDKPLSPHWDFFQDGVEFGERQSEKRIEELKVQNENLETRCNELFFQVNELAEQIEKMKCCETCRYYHYHEIGTGNKDCILWYRDKVFCEHKNMWELGR